jgi:hypothetical protein
MQSRALRLHAAEQRKQQAIQAKAAAVAARAARVAAASRKGKAPVSARSKRCLGRGKAEAGADQGGVSGSVEEASTVAGGTAGNVAGPAGVSEEPVSALELEEASRLDALVGASHVRGRPSARVVGRKSLFVGTLIVGVEASRGRKAFLLF